LHEGHACSNFHTKAEVIFFYLSQAVFIIFLLMRLPVELFDCFNRKEGLLHKAPSFGIIFLKLTGFALKRTHVEIASYCY
jgi:hypothetical protein